MLKLNTGAIFEANRQKNSNTTLVKVKFEYKVRKIIREHDSNTTLVKVKYGLGIVTLIWLIHSNTTLVKVKLEEIINGWIK